MRRVNSIIVLIGCIFTSTLSIADRGNNNNYNQPNPNFLKGNGDGWFWYKKDPEPEIVEETPEPLQKQVIIQNPVENKPEKTKPLSVEWFQKEYPIILNQAIDNPTEENVKSYRYATRIMLDKTSNFTRQFQRQSLLDPLLDESVRSPFSSAMRGSYQNWTNQQKRIATEAISKKAGLWVFLDDKCSFCHLQYPVVHRTAKERGFEVTYITPDGVRPSWMMGDDDLRKDDGQSKTLRIGVRPAVALVVPPDSITVLTQGMLSQDLLEERILHAGDAAGLITGDIRKNAFPEERGILTTQDIEEIGVEILQTPKALTGSTQQRLEKRY